LYNNKFQIWTNNGEGSSRVITVKDYNSFYQLLFLPNGDIACITGSNNDCVCLLIFYLEDNYERSRILDKREEGYADNSILNLSDNLFYFLSSESDVLKIYVINNDYKCVYMIEVELILDLYK
jgi:hypothetical protein